MRLNCKPRTPDSPLRPDTKSGLRRARPTGARRGGGTRLGQEGCSPRRRAMAAATAGSTGFLLQHSPGAEAHAPTLRAGAGHARPRPRPFTYFLTERPPRLPRPPVGGGHRDRPPTPPQLRKRALEERSSLRVGFSPDILVVKGSTCFQSERMI